MFWNKTKPAIDELPNGITVSSIPEDRPKFARVYTKVLSDGRRVEVNAKTSTGLGRWFRGELTQPNGRWVLFDPKEIADKILDPALVPLVEEFCSEVSRLDAAFMANNPGEFVDEAGSTWRRV
jgi:hypothetical protein